MRRRSQSMAPATAVTTSRSPRSSSRQHSCCSRSRTLLQLGRPPLIRWLFGPPAFNARCASGHRQTKHTTIRNPFCYMYFCGCGCRSLTLIARSELQLRTVIPSGISYFAQNRLSLHGIIVSFLPTTKRDQACRVGRRAGTQSSQQPHVAGLLRCVQRVGLC